MTDAERELLEAAVAFRVSWQREDWDDDCAAGSKAFREAQEKVRLERLNAELPGWEEEFRRLLHTQVESRRIWEAFSTRISRAGITVDGEMGLTRKHWPK